MTVVIHSFPVWLPQTQIWMYNQIRYLPDDIEPHIVCEVTQNLDQFGLPNIHSLSKASPWKLYWDKGLRKLKIRRYLGFVVVQARRKKAQILHSHFGNVGWANIGAARRVGLKHVVTFYGLDVNHLPVKIPLWRQRYRQLFAHVDCILCEGSFMARSVVNLGCPEHKVRVHHLGVDLRKIEFKPRRWTAGQSFRVLLAASFREKKGIPCALEALGRLRPEVPLEITLIGEADETERSQLEKKKIKRTIARCGLRTNIRILGYQSHSALMAQAYNHHIFLSPSVTSSDGDTEGGAPVSIIEMAASGMPVVSTFHCDIPEVIESGKSGLLAEERNVDGLVQHLRWLIRHHGQWTSMLEAARRRMENEYDAQVQGEKLAAIYREIVVQ
jgi:colanic acid/amylovoran biosynthesis glycosyltransferase